MFLSAIEDEMKTTLIFDVIPEGYSSRRVDNSCGNKTKLLQTLKTKFFKNTLANVTGNIYPNVNLNVWHNISTTPFKSYVVFQTLKKWSTFSIEQDFLLTQKRLFLLTQYYDNSNVNFHKYFTCIHLIK